MAGDNEYYVEKRGPGEWAVQRKNAERASAILPTQAEAIARAKELARIADRMWNVLSKPTRASRASSVNDGPRRNCGVALPAHQRLLSLSIPFEMGQQLHLVL
jgi:hypothetical protein